MREIKFRAWDKRNNVMLESFQDGDSFGDYVFQFCFNTDGTFKAILFKSTNDDLEEYELPIMQYTGLKDRNGKEIYEGDIIEDSFGNRKGFIKYNKYLASFEIENYDGIHLFTSDNCKDFFTVIGNIYENKNLIE